MEPGSAVSLQVEPSPPSGPLLFYVEPLSGTERCLRCPLVDETVASLCADFKNIFLLSSLCVDLSG